MKFLLDVNVLVAMGFLGHEFHGRVITWLRQATTKKETEFLTCSITELGFVRVLSQAPQYGFTVGQARSVLLKIKKSTAIRVRFVPDNHDVSHLPGWVRGTRQVTDGHLVELAAAHGAILATLDEKIAGSFLIPE